MALETISQHSHPLIRWFIFILFFFPIFSPFPFPTLPCWFFLWIVHTSAILLDLFICVITHYPLGYIFCSCCLSWPVGSSLTNLPVLLLNLPVESLTILQVRNRSGSLPDCSNLQWFSFPLKFHGTNDWYHTISTLLLLDNLLCLFFPNEHFQIIIFFVSSFHSSTGNSTAKSQKTRSITWTNGHWLSRTVNISHGNKWWPLWG